MFFGFRLGPVRIGASSKGQVHGGVSAGPFSASAPLGKRGDGRPAELLHPIALDAAVAELVALGWRVTGQGDGWAMVAHGWHALHLQAVPGGVRARRIASRRKTAAWTIVVAVAVVLFCWWAEVTF